MRMHLMRVLLRVLLTYYGGLCLWEALEFHGSYYNKKLPKGDFRLGFCALNYVNSGIQQLLKPLTTYVRGFSCVFALKGAIFRTGAILRHTRQAKQPSQC